MPIAISGKASMKPMKAPIAAPVLSVAVREREPAIVLRRKMTPAKPRPIQKTGGIGANPTEPGAGGNPAAAVEPCGNGHQAGQQQADPGGDDLRRLDDLHRPDDRRDRDPDAP